MPQKRSIHWMKISGFFVAIIIDEGVPTDARVSPTSLAYLFRDEDDTYDLEVVHDFIEKSEVQKTFYGMQ